ncbi:MATE family efflux transporter [Clostridium massiliamazoniense]|uniref:MATE family efflux transporter n=1 Tax=Clostridium massiliamazoniense TaxID=1347366 RepID=UPI0006D7DF79|nr:MATE family efflux transporter [Clostridium massiliamazoniense]
MSNGGTDLGKGNIKKLLVTLALPAIIAQLVNILYNIVDRIFIGRIQNGEMAMAGVGVAFPILMLISAFSALIGMGGAPLAAIKMGAKDKEGAEKIISNSFSTLIVVSVILTVGFTIFKVPILNAFGASEATIKYAIDYLSIYLIGTIFIQFALGLNPFINTQGFAQISMSTVMIGAIINIVLDPIFIFTFNMGVKGAALATILGQFVSAIWVLSFIFGKKNKIRVRKKYIIPDMRILGAIIALGVSPFIMQATESLVVVSLNNKLQAYGGDLAVGAMTIMSSIMQIVLLPLVGLSQGAQPIISYNYGAKSIKRVKETFKLLVICCLAYTSIMWVSIMVFPEMFVKIFNNNPELIEITAKSMKIFFFGIFLFGAQIACQQTFLALGQAKNSLILALLRKIFLLVPLIFILPEFFKMNKWKLNATLIAEPISDIVATIITIITFWIFYKKKLTKIKEEFEEVK